MISYKTESYPFKESKSMEEQSAIRNQEHLALLDLRGHFHLESGLYVYDSSFFPESFINGFPVTDERLILVRPQSTSLIDLSSRETLWTIACPAREAALDLEQEMLALGVQGRVYLWNLRSGSLKQTLQLGDDVPTDLSFHPQGLLLVG